MSISHGKLLTGSVLDDEIKLEEQAISDGVARYNRLADEAVKRGDGAALKPAERLLVHWFRPVAEAIRQDKEMMQRGKPSVGAAIWGPIVWNVDHERLAVIALHEAIGKCLPTLDGVLVSNLAHSIGRAVLAEINLDLMRKADRDTRKTRSARLDAGENKKTVYEQERERIKDLDQRFRSVTPTRVNWWAKKTLADPVWSRSVCTHVGSRLLWHIQENCNCSFEDGMFRKAFHHVRKQKGKKAPAFIVMDENVRDVINQGHDVRSLLRPRYLPMIVKPYPFEVDADGHPTHEGGYVKIRTPFMSKPTPEQKLAIEDADLTKVCKALAAVSGAGLRINRSVLDVVRHIWETGGGELGVPHRSNLPSEPKPVGYDGDAKKGERWKAVAPEVKKAYKRASAEIIEENIVRVSARHEFLSKLAIAEQFKEQAAIYFPHQFDHRGRMYAIPVHLNYQGDDVCRGLLEFSRGVGVNIGGIERLKVHAANMYGIDNVSFEDRITWTESLWHKIMACACDPLACDFWRHADESDPGACDGTPWQFLAACFALANPNEAGAHLPVKADGTCNGLQHYTALGRDERAAPAVNMVPGIVPNSVYKEVAYETNKIAYRDAVTNTVAAELLDFVGNITKPLVKQPVMTTAYGVTKVGAREQTNTALRKRGFEGESLYETSKYLAGATLQGIGQVCASAVEIMEWIRTCARLIVSKNRSVKWTTPLGFPVVLPHRNWKSLTVKTILQDVVIQVENEEASVSKDEQVNASAPGMIHSFDASHLMMTAIECGDADVDFIAVHDAYATHAGTQAFVDVSTRKQFIELHEQDVLADILAQWRTEHPDIDFPEPPAKGTLDINEVIHSPYFFH